MTADRAAAIEGQLSGLTGSDGTPFSVDVIPSVRGAGDPAAPGFHQIELKYVAPPARLSSVVNNDPSGPSGARSGEWWAGASVRTWAHETMHLLGFPDRYLGTQPDLLVDGMRYPLPKFTGDKSNKAQLEAWWKKVLDAEAALEAKLVRWQADWESSWESWRWDPEEYIEAGDHVVAVLRVHAQGRGSGVDVERLDRRCGSEPPGGGCGRAAA